MATEADCCIVATPTSTQGRRAHTREVQHRSPRRAAPTSHLRSRHGGSRGGEAAAPAHHQYGSWVAAPRTATSGAGASAAQRRVQAGASESRAATDSPRRPAALAPRASRRRESGEVRARANWTFRAPRPPLGRPAPAVRRHARARARSECGRPLRRGHRRWPRGSWLASRRRSDVRRPICTWWSIPAAAAHRPRGMGSVFGTNSRATRRAGELAAADPAHRARLGRRLELDARSRPEISPCGAPFGHELETAIDHGALGARGGIWCAVGRLCDAP